MERPVKTYKIVKPEDLPLEEKICEAAKDYKVILEFDSDLESLRQSFGKDLKSHLVNHLVGIHTNEPMLKISELISLDTIEAHADFFEQCAKDYHTLATQLMHELVNHLKLNIDWDFPSLTFNQLKTSGAVGKFNDWRYNVHGFHCGFYNERTEQAIEASIMCGEEFGELDPYFFTEYIISTSTYYPLPVNIYEPFHDGERILNRMIELGRFESIPSNWPNRNGVVVKESRRTEVKVFEPEKDYIRKSKFNFLKFLGLKK